MSDVEPWTDRVRGFASRHWLWLTLPAVAASWLAMTQPAAAGKAVLLPLPAQDTPRAATPGRETAVFAGGCFWGVQAVFQHTQGVLNAVSGYSGGSKETASYRAIGSGRTGHAEAVQVTFDPSRISYGKLLQIYFSVAHDPTQRNRQGPDTGPQYRSALFYKDAVQKDVAQKYIAQLDQARAFPRPIVTELAPLAAFYRAEDYHQDYAMRHPEQPYIAIHDRPKIDNLRAVFPDLWRAQPVLVAHQAKAS
jgi:peptide-methionine (S)-S-oxide reductase